MKQNLYKFFYTFAITMVCAFIVYIIHEYINYDPLVTSAPFSVNVIVGLVFLIAPSIVFFLIGLLLKKKFN